MPNELQLFIIGFIGGVMFTIGISALAISLYKAEFKQ